jgi:hypothetical protein
MKVLKEELLELVAGSGSPWVYIFGEQQIASGPYAGEWEYDMYGPANPTSSNYAQVVSPTYVQQGDFEVSNVIKGDGGPPPASTEEPYNVVEAYDENGEPYAVMTTYTVM